MNKYKYIDLADDAAFSATARACTVEPSVRKRDVTPPPGSDNIKNIKINRLIKYQKNNKK